MIKNSKPKCEWKSKLLLGEGVLWVRKLNSVFFVDIKKRKILSFNIKTKSKSIFNINKEIGFLSHIKKNIFILGLKSEIRVMDLKKKIVIFSINIELNKKRNRINDGKADPLGRLWFGTMDSLEKKKSGSLYCLDHSLKLHKVDSKYYTPNGPAFLNKNTFYHTDSKKKIIYKIKVNNDLKIIYKKKFIRFNKKEGSPDGMTTDIKNNLWVCHYRGACVSIYNLKGRRIHQIKIPAKNITNCVFGGSKNNQLFISTARKGMTSKDLKKYPFSGGLFSLKLNILGKKINYFKSRSKFF